MRLIDRLHLRVRSFLEGNRVEQELDREVRFHLEEHVAELTRSGMSRSDAEAAARRAFGGVEQIKESVRDTWHVRAIHNLAQDLRYGVRMLTKAPAFTAVAVLTLALGIGATTAIFSVVQGVLIKPLSYPDADRIVQVLTHWPKTGHDGDNVSGADLVDVRDSTHAFDAFSMIWSMEIGVRAGGRSQLVGTGFVNTGFFDVFGVQPAAGRTFRAGDVKKAAVVSSGYASEHFGSAAGALGHTLSVDDANYEIVGVMPAGFHFPALADVWVPIADQPDNMNRSAHNYPIVARRRTDVSPQALDAAMAALSGRLATTYKDTNADKTLIAVPLQERAVGSMRSTLYLLLGAVALLFLIACANVANLLLARASVRTREIALRAALWCRSVAHSPAARRGEPAARRSGRRARTRRDLYGHGCIESASLRSTCRDSTKWRLTVACSSSQPQRRCSRAWSSVSYPRGTLRESMFGRPWPKAVPGVRNGGGSGRLRTGLAVAEIGLAVVLAIGGGVLFPAASWPSRPLRSATAPRTCSSSRPTCPQPTMWRARCV